MDNTNSRLHPLLTAAAISITVFSAVGVATLTGLVPDSIGSQKAPPPALETPKEPIKAIRPKPVKKPVAKTSRRPLVEPAVYREFTEAPMVARAPEAIETPAPVGIVATVEEVKEVTTPGEHTAIGPIAGGVAGAVVGNQFGHGNGKKVMTVLGALGGAMAGKHIEKQARGEKHWETTVRLADGSQRMVPTPTQPLWNSGDRVRYVDGRLQPV